MNYIVKNGESINDVCLNSTGTLENLELVLRTNGFNEWVPDLHAGQIIIIPKNAIIHPKSKYSLGLYPSNNNSAAADLDSQIDSLINFIDQIAIDVDRNIYPFVKIGSQLWLKENLKTTHYIDGTAIPNIQTESSPSYLWSSDVNGAYCWYNDDISNKTIYGALYNWYAVNNVHGLAIPGWRVPSVADFNTLINYCGISNIGGKLKEIGLSHWLTPNSGAVDVFGFKIVGTGRREDYQNYNKINELNCMWTSEESDAADAYNYTTHYDDTYLTANQWVKNMGLSVRLVRDV